MSNSKVLSPEISLKLSFFKFIFILIVVLFHSNFRYYYPFIEDLTAISTSYFFCVSAFFFYRGLNSENIGSRFKKRCIGLLLPYFLWNTIYLLFNINVHKFTLSQIISGFTISPFCTPSWYLLTLFIFLLAAPLLQRVLIKKYSTIIILLLGISISYLGYIHYQRELATIPYIGGYLVRMAEYLTPYLFGSIIGIWLDNKLQVTRSRALGGFIGCCIIILLLFCNIAPTIRWFLWVLFPIVLWEALPESIFVHTKLIRTLTEPSFLINMLHCYLLFILGILTEKTTIITGKSLSALNVLLTLAFSYIIYYLLKLLLPKFLQILTGNRIK